MNKITITIDGKETEVDLPAFGEIKITVIDHQVKFIETTIKQKME